jgi:hypothetical protein
MSDHCAEEIPQSLGRVPLLVPPQFSQLLRICTPLQKWRRTFAKWRRTSRANTRCATGKENVRVCKKTCGFYPKQHHQADLGDDGKNRYFQPVRSKIASNNVDEVDEEFQRRQKNIEKDAPAEDVVERVHRFLQQTNIPLELLQIFQKIRLRSQSDLESLVIVARLHNPQNLVTEKHVEELRVPLEVLDGVLLGTMSTKEVNAYADQAGDQRPNYQVPKYHHRDVPSWSHSTLGLLQAVDHLEPLSPFHNHHDY